MPDTTTPEGRKKRKAQLLAQKQEGMITAFTRKYNQTGNKKYLHFLGGLGIDSDYAESDYASGPKYSDAD